MTKSISSLWPSQIRAEIQSPFTILQTQAEALSQQTGQLLFGDVKRRVLEPDKVTLTFAIVVPALDYYRHNVMNVVHGKDMIYPAIVDAEVFRAGMRGFAAFHDAFEAYQASVAGVEAKKPVNRADNDQEFTELVAKVLQSAYVVSAAQSLIARANDAFAHRDRAAQTTAPTPVVETQEPTPKAPPTSASTGDEPTSGNSAP